MSAPALHIAMELISADILPATISTSKVVKLLNNKKWHRKVVCKLENRELLGGKRYGAGRNLEFETVKVIQFKERLKDEHSD